MIQTIEAGVLRVAYETFGPDDGWPVVLLHGFPYDPRSCEASGRRLGESGARVVVPYLRGYGPTGFLSSETPRSGEQAALGADLLALLDALGIDAAVLAGYDWGGRAACVVSALWPARARGLVSCGGYNIQDIAKSAEPARPDAEHRYWYQYYLHGERGRRGLARHRREFCKLLWSLWSPRWRFTDATFDATAPSFDNPDFVEVVVHSYRHRYGLVAGDPACASIEGRLASQPAIAVPTIALFGDADGVAPLEPAKFATHRARFTGTYEERVLDGIGHDVPQEAPDAFAQAVLDLHRA